MSQLDDAISRYNRLLENGPCRDLAWVNDLHKRMEEEHLSAGGRLICPFLRPNFITRRQYDTLVKTGEALISAIDRMQHMVLSSPTLLARMELLPAEKMLAAIDPGYSGAGSGGAARFARQQWNPAGGAVQCGFAQRRRLY